MCFSGSYPPPRGLTDLLLQPCACTGTQAFVHLRQAVQRGKNEVVAPRRQAAGSVDGR